MSDKVVTEELVNSLNGFEEVAITKAFGAPLDTLAGSLTLRALVFVIEKRSGARDLDAYQTVMSCPVADITDRFDTDAVVEVDDAGKASTPETAPN